MFFGRGLNKIKAGGYTLPDMYKAYTKDIEEDSPYDIPYSVYVTITTSYIKKLIQRVFKGFKVILPYRLGAIQIVKKKMYFKSQLTKGKGIDWAATNKYGKVIHHLNEHSGGYKYLFYWDRTNARLKYINSYRFIPTRTLKRTLAKLIKIDKQDYFEVS
jgi:hypothetical protein